MNGKVKPGSVCQTWNKQAKIGTSPPFLAAGGVISETGSRISQSSKQQTLTVHVDGQFGQQSADQLPTPGGRDE
jgi:hypothetical protein